MRLEHYIADLLFRYDGVVVPGFGGFVSNRIPAGFDRVTHVFRPAHKAIGFNPLLRSNDGLLIDYVARVNRLSYELAAARVSSQVKIWNEALSSGSDLVLSPLGRVYSEAGRTVFMPELGENFERSSFGLGMFQSIRSDATRLSERNIVAGEKTLLKTRTAPIVRPIDWSAFKNAAVFVPLVGFSLGLGLLLQKDAQRPVDQSRSGFEWPRLDERPARLEHPETTTRALPKASSAIESALKSAPEASSAPREIAAEVKPALVVKAKPVAEPSPAEIALVVGAFRETSNAERICDQARLLGFSPKIQALDNGLHRVVLLGFETRAAAELGLAEVRTKLEPSAWVLDRSN